jgi:CheY-like chemotaxis protein
VIREAADQSAALTHQLLAFSRKLPLQATLLNLSSVVDEMQRMLPRLLGEDVQLTTVLSPHPALVRADPNQVKQVLMNLAVNARDAMPEGGRLVMETSAVMMPDPRLPKLQIPPGPYVLLTVADNGCGMDQATLNRIFEPFLSTKAEGKGTGLGLATVFGIVKQSGGSIAVESHPGVGTTFRIFLPRAAESAILPDSQSAGHNGSCGRGETVLLVDDRADVRTFVRRMLDQNGYSVLEAGGAAEALQTGERHPGPIDVLLTDVVMPGTSGRQLAEQLQRTRPATKVIYMSGHAAADLLHRGELADSPHLLSKPFKEKQLLETIQIALGARSRTESTSYGPSVN